MDTVAYLKQIEIPLLKGLRRGLITEDKRKKFRFFYSLFFESMEINPIPWKIMIFNPESNASTKYQYK